jgi:hypothetical protein
MSRKKNKLSVNTLRKLDPGLATDADYETFTRRIAEARTTAERHDLLIEWMRMMSDRMESALDKMQRANAYRFN